MPKTFDECIEDMAMADDWGTGVAGEAIADLRDAYEVRERLRAKIASREPDTHKGIARMFRRILGREDGD